MRALILLALTIVLLIGSGCTANQEQTIGQRYTVVNKDIRSNSYLLEISNSATHMYIEVTKNRWDRTSVGDTVTMNDRGELVAVNNEPVSDEQG